MISKFPMQYSFYMMIYLETKEKNIALPKKTLQTFIHRTLYNTKCDKEHNHPLVKFKICKNYILFNI